MNNLEKWPLTMRALDVVLSAAGLVLALPLLALLFVLGLLDTGSPLFRQLRVGRHRKPFTIFKLRTMGTNTPSVASHLASAAAITPYGRFLRRTKLDELPQLWNVLRGDMSLVGPRPCLFSQEELIEYRDRLGVLDARPGVTGVAQLSGIDMATPKLLAETDAKMLSQLNVALYFRCIASTVRGGGSGDRIGRVLDGEGGQ